LRSVGKEWGEERGEANHSMEYNSYVKKGWSHTSELKRLHGMVLKHIVTITSLKLLRKTQDLVPLRLI
jgi:hypothetical protein